MKRFEVREVEAPLAAGHISRFPLDWTVGIVGGEDGVATALAALFADSGHAAAPADSANAVIFLGGLQSFAGIDDAMAVHRSAFDVAHARAEELSVRGGAFITVQNTGGDFGTGGRADVRAWSAGLPGLVKTAAQEWPSVIAKAIDLECDDMAPHEMARRLVAEILCGGTEVEVGLRADGRRTTIVMDSAPLSPSTSTARTIDASSVVVATGGGRGVTAAALITLARDSQARIALLGRTALVDEAATTAQCHTEEALKRQLLADAKAAGAPITPRALQQQASAVINAREVRATLDALHAAGSEAAYYAVDIQNEQELGAALDAIRQRWGAIHALVHGAGVLADKPIARKSAEEFDRVMSVKVAGLRNLLAATQHDALRAICLFSSIVARTGNAGQADYAAANSVLDAVAAAEAKKRGPSCLVKSINWGPWAGGMVTPALAEHFRARGMSLIALDEGARAFADEIQAAPGGRANVVLL